MKGVRSFRIPAVLAITVGLVAVVYARVQGGPGDTRPTPARDAETAKRFLTKEPVYQSKDPKYCLLTFGLQGKTRVWLVFDSVPNPLLPGKDKDYLYVDRNGNGDLTEEGERIEATVHQVPNGIRLGGVPPGTIPLLEFPIGEIKDSEGMIYKDVKVMVQWYMGRRRPCTIYASTAERGTLSTEINKLVFADCPQDAPVLPFGGPMTMRFALGMTHSFSLTEEFNLQAEIGTFGSGPGSFVFMMNDTFPKDLHPVAEIEWPHREAGKSPITMNVSLKQRC
ncbi:MAG: hypothetical protein HY040_02065 [Planctomycetes bacterium]|nr:hypothetical protein [Planctomycetota bacterium]